MAYDTIIQWLTTIIFGWLFIVMTAQMKLTFNGKSFFYMLANWLGMISSITGFILSAYNMQIAVSLSPYVLFTCALIGTSVVFDYFNKNNQSNTPEWAYQKVKFFRTLAISVLIVLITFIYISLKSELNHTEASEVIYQKIDSLDHKIDSNAVNSVSRYKNLIEKVNSNTKKIEDAAKIAKATNTSTRQAGRNLDKKTSSVKRDTEAIKKELKDNKKTEEKEPRKKIFGIF